MSSWRTPTHWAGRPPGLAGPCPAPPSRLLEAPSTQGGLLARAVLFNLITTLNQRLIPLRLFAFLSHST